ncbi:2-hydroxyacid dehydrogenase [Oricola sp.]|uniref:2-hydroxyacid dehydrogenase n=1 Tax=Oricola sp. TaxID=1979950 RepID=UPI0025CCE333|nr:2-hydroxyacid dehydrogenase [Oricola sp.]MCI5074768.1 2-hydroxyacid dehydrogenase [Oricola sp.]
MPQDLKSVSVLMPANFYPRAYERIVDTFDAVLMDTPDPALIPADKRERITGMAALLGPQHVPIIDALPALQIISNFGVGYHPVPSLHAIEKGICVTHTPDVLNEEVADTALAVLLNTLRRFDRAGAWVRDGRWAKDGNFPVPLLSLRGRTVGIFGLGRIGKAVARRIEGFGLPVHYHNRKPAQDVAYPWHASLKELATAVDTLICVVPGTEETRHAVNAEVLEALGPNGVLVNIGRGTVVDEQALIAALQSGTIAAAGLDVFENEPNVPAELIAMENTFLTPHIGSASVPTRAAMGDLVADNLVAWFEKGEAVTPVPEARHLTKHGAN